jgi:ATP-dependent Lon protease
MSGQDDFSIDLSDLDLGEDEAEGAEEAAPVMVSADATEKMGDKIEIPDQLPLLPIKNTVAFPGTILPLNVGREKSKLLLDTVLTGSKLIGVVSQRFAETDDPSINDMYRIGTACMVLKLLKLPDGTQTIVIHGLARIGIEDLVQQNPFWIARVNAIHDRVKKSTELDALVHNVRHAADRVIELSPSIPEEARIVLGNLESPGALADFLGANLSLGLVHRQELLETFDVADRLKKVHAALAGQIEVLELSEKLQTEVKGQIENTQREYYLQQQMRAIQKELGETDARTSDIEELRKKVEAANMPEGVAFEANREIDRMQRIPQASPDYSVALDYVTWLCEMPWNNASEDRLDLKRARSILNKDHYGLEKVKKRIIEFLAVRKLKPDGQGPILCLTGPPGVGKTSLGRSIARALGRKFIRIALGGVHDEAEIRGHRRTYISAMPGRVMQEIRKAGTNNPVFMLDEVDKIGQDFRGDPASALLEVLDPQQNATFTDHYLDVPFDLSQVMFIATANYMDPIPAALLDRMEIMELSGYTHREKLEISKKYLVPRQLEANGLTAAKVAFADEALLRIIGGHTREAGVRNLEREIGSVCRGIAAATAEGRTRKVMITGKNVGDYLGPPWFQPEAALRTSEPGVVTGLAFTPVGGEILFVEATQMPGTGQLNLTGQLGDVMRESAQAAYSIVRSRAESLGIDPKLVGTRDIHIHVPAGAIPKDGPSAGVAMLTALVSMFKERPVRSDVAMTGEITLRGLVLPIGGVKEKVLAAHRAGITHVILPARNKVSLTDVPQQIRDEMTFTFATKVDQVLRAAMDISGGKKRSSRKKRRATSKPRKTKKGTNSRRSSAK